MPQRMIIAGNWKMNVGPDVAGELALTLAASDAIVAFLQSGGELIACPPYLSLPVVAQRLRGSGIKVFGQNCHWEQNGAYTGEISASMLQTVGCSGVILGHSEQRRDHADTDQRVGARARAAAHAGLQPIICIGETADEYAAGLTIDVISSQIDTIVEHAGVDSVRGAFWAYEPRWAIGTGVTPTLDEIQAVHEAIRQRCRTYHGIDLPILYGGSVTDDNAADILSLQDVNGALIGGASIQVARFQRIVEQAQSALRDQCSLGG